MTTDNHIGGLVPASGNEESPTNEKERTMMTEEEVLEEMACELEFHAALLRQYAGLLSGDEEHDLDNDVEEEDEMIEEDDDEMDDEADEVMAAACGVLGTVEDLRDMAEDLEELISFGRVRSAKERDEMVDQMLEEAEKAIDSQIESHTGETDRKAVIVVKEKP
jgi:hypothetical protein